MSATFISYRREDSAGYAGRLHEELAERLGPRQVFRDVDTLRAGQDFEDAIRQRLEHCQACVVMIGPGWLKAQTASGERRLDQPGDYVCMEIAAALQRPGVLVIPVLVGGATMPAQDDVPEAIRPLARRHAMSVRDETWEADMDRLAAALRQTGPAIDPRRTVPPHAPRAAPLPRYAVPIGLALAVAAVIALFLRGTLDTADDTPRTLDLSDAASGSDAAPPAPGPALAIDVPGREEIRLGDVIFAVLSGSVQSRGATTRVWLRVRTANEHLADAANISDASFRLACGGDLVPATGGLNEILGHHSLRQYVIRFDVPSRRTEATLRIEHAGAAADLPLDLTPNGQAATHEAEDERDGLSHATIVDIRRGDDPLIAAGDLSTTLLRVRVRRFRNVTRVSVAVRWNNGGSYPAATGDLVLRLAAGGEVRSPVQQPSEVVAAKNRLVGDVVFDVPPTAKRVTLNASLKGTDAARTWTLY